jgi:hypothetical protein
MLNFFDKDENIETDDHNTRKQLLHANLKNIFDELFLNINKEKVYYMTPEKEEDHYIWNFMKSDTTINFVNNPLIDDVFAEFLIECFNKMSLDKFSFIFKYIVLFRESINYNKNVMFTQTKNTNSIPYYSNEVFSYLTKNGFMENLSDEDKVRVVSAIFYFCNWLSEKKYTAAKINILSN